MERLGYINSGIAEHPACFEVAPRLNLNVTFLLFYGQLCLTSLYQVFFGVSEQRYF